jgi:hypothetical protein
LALEVIVVDNASPDGTAALVRERFPGVRLLALERNAGFGVAANAGARVATGDLLFFLNPDTEVSQGALPRIALALESHPDAAAFGFRQVDAEGQLQLSLGRTRGFATELARRNVQRRPDRGSPRLAAALDKLLSSPLPVPWVSGATLLLRRADFERIGGFDERFFLYFEDIDLCLRLRARGGRIYYDPTVTLVHHRGRSAAGATIPQWTARLTPVKVRPLRRGSMSIPLSVEAQASNQRRPIGGPLLGKDHHALRHVDVQQQLEILGFRLASLVSRRDPVDDLQVGPHPPKLAEISNERDAVAVYLRPGRALRFEGHIEKPRQCPK